MFSNRSKKITVIGLVLLSVVNNLIESDYQVVFQAVLATMVIALLLTTDFSKAMPVVSKTEDDDDGNFGELITRFVTRMPWPVCVVSKHQEFVYTNSTFDALLDEPVHYIQETDIEMRTLLLNALDNLNQEQFEVNYNYKVYDVSSIAISKKYHLFLFADITKQVTEERKTKRFLADASHELKTPITAIKGIAEVLLNNQERDSEILLDFLDQIRVESNRLETMVADMLTISKLSSHTISIDKTYFDLANLLAEVSKSFRKEFELKHLNLKVPTHSLTMLADYEKIRTVIDNLVGNALHYSEEGTVTVDYYRDKDDIVITVSDEGVGIDLDKQSRIFDRFYRVDSARNRRVGGSGLGLSITKQIVEEHDGTITVNSKLHNGTTFVCRFPQT